MFTVNSQKKMKINSYPVAINRTAALLCQKDMSLHQMCTNPRQHITVATKFILYGGAPYSWVSFYEDSLL